MNSAINPPPPAPTPPSISPPLPPPIPLGGSRGLAIDTLARTLWGEARDQPTAGLQAVASVVLNRARIGLERKRLSWWGCSVIGVCRAPFQFSCWNDDDPNLPLLKRVGSGDRAFLRCLEEASRAVDGRLADNTGGATHYPTRACHPAWAAGHSPAVTIGDHLFYTNIEG